MDYSNSLGDSLIQFDYQFTSFIHFNFIELIYSFITKRWIPLNFHKLIYWNSTNKIITV